MCVNLAIRLLDQKRNKTLFKTQDVSSVKQKKDTRCIKTQDVPIKTTY